MFCRCYLCYPNRNSISKAFEILDHFFYFFTHNISPTNELRVLLLHAKLSFLTLESKIIEIIEIILIKKERKMKMTENNDIMPNNEAPSLDTKKKILDLETENYKLKKEVLKLRKKIDKLESKNRPLPPTLTC